jgi:Type II secretion system (T2SS), protein E, N-terminal domain/von Willebrand factor type A domain
MPWTFSSQQKVSEPAGWLFATEHNRDDASRWLGKVNINGGTEMGQAIEFGLNAHASTHQEQTNSRNLAIVLVTDGQVTGEDGLLGQIGLIPEQARPRLFCLGIDRAVNGSVMQRLAGFTGGTYELVESEKRLDEVLHRFSEEIGSPAVTHLRIESSPPSAIDFAGSQIMTLYSGRSLTIYGQTKASRSLKLNLSGVLPGGGTWSEQVATEIVENDHARKTLLPLWGKSKVRALEDNLAASGRRDTELSQQIVECSLKCNVLSRLTAFVAVDESEKVTSGVAPHSILQPSESPEGWKLRIPAMNKSTLIATPKRASVATGLQIESTTSTEAIKRLLESGTISSEQLSEAEALSKRNGKSTVDSLVALGYLNARDIGLTVAKIANTTYVDLHEQTIPTRIIELVPDSIARENIVIPISESAGLLTIAISDPNDVEKIERLRFILNRDIVTVVSSAEEIVNAIGRSYGQIAGESADSTLHEFADSEIADLDVQIYQCAVAPFAMFSNPELSLSMGRMCDSAMDDLDEQVYAGSSLRLRVSQQSMRPSVVPAPKDNLPPSIERLVDFIIQDAIDMKATHVLILPGSNQVAVSIVVEGKVIEREPFPQRLSAELIARLKALAHVDSSDPHGFQSGTFQFPWRGRDEVVKVHIAGNQILLELPKASESSQLPDVVEAWWKSHSPANANQ